MAKKDSYNSLLRSAKGFFSGTLLSRTTGLGREVTMAALFGTLPVVAAFWMAYRFAYLMRRMFGEGALNSAFIPHFETLRQENEAKAARFFYDLSIGLSLFLLCLVVLIESILGGCLLFSEWSPSTVQVLRLTMLLLPAILFICLYALNTSFLHCEGTFFLPSAAPALLNIIWIVSIFFLIKIAPERAMERLAMILVFAFALQWMVTLPRAYRYMQLGEKEASSSRQIWLLLRPFLLAIVGVTATQINTAFDAVFARLATSEGPAQLWYALRLQQLPLALLGIGLTSALLPPISRALQEKRISDYLYLVNFALKRAMLYLIPVSFAILTLGFLSVNLIYGHGQFSQSATLYTTLCLWAYGLGLLPMALVLLLAAAFYAEKNYLVPTVSSLICVGCNLALNAYFVWGLQWGAVSVAVATTLCATLNASILGYQLYRKGRLDLTGILPACVKVTGSGALAAILTMVLMHQVDNTLAWYLHLPFHPFPRNVMTQLIQFGEATIVFGSFLGLFGYLFRLPNPFRVGEAEWIK